MRQKFQKLALAVVVTLVSTITLAHTSIIVQSTTSTANSGLYDHLLPQF